MTQVICTELFNKWGISGFEEHIVKVKVELNFKTFKKHIFRISIEIEEIFSSPQQKSISEILQIGMCQKAVYFCGSN